MGFERPALLALLALAPAAAYVAWRGRARLSLRRRIVSTALRLAALTSLVLALVGLTPGGAGPDLTVFLLDTSSSVLLAQQSAEFEWVRAAVEQSGPDRKVAAVQFAERARVAALPARAGGDASAFLSLDPYLGSGATNFAGAIAAGLALIGEEGSGRLILLSDGGDNAGGLNAAVAAAQAKGIPISTVSSAGLGTVDVALESVVAPPTVRTGQAFEVRVVVTSRRQVQGRLRLWAGDELVADTEVALETGGNPFAVRVPGRSAGFQELRAEVLADADPQLGNNVLEAYVRVLPPARVLVLGAADATAGPAAVLRQAGLAVSAGAVSSIPEDYRDLSGFETVFMVNVPAGASLWTFGLFDK